MNHKNKEYAKITAYNDEYCRLKAESDIIGSWKDAGAFQTFWDLNGCKTQLLLLQGSILKYRSRISDLEEDFERYKRAAKNSGKSVPLTMSPEMLDNFYKFNAALDIYLEEKDAVEKRIADFENVKQAENNSMILCYGCRGERTLVNDKLHMIDGQHVAETSDGIFYIDETNSPFDGLGVEPYNKLCSAWLNERQKAKDEKLKKAQEEARKYGRPVPKSLGIKSVKKVNISDLPKFPEGEKNYKEDMKKEQKFDKDGQVKPPNRSTGIRPESTQAEREPVAVTVTQDVSARPAPQEVVSEWLKARRKKLNLH